MALIPSQGAGPAERFERREAIARSREALKTLKPAELKALTLLAEGYSYVEIGEMTGYSQTNRPGRLPLRLPLQRRRQPRRPLPLPRGRPNAKRLAV